MIANKGMNVRLLTGCCPDQLSCHENFKHIFFFLVDRVEEWSLKIWSEIYSGILIFQTSKGNENWFEKSYSSRNWGKITVFDSGEGNDFWYELSGGSKKS